MIGLGNYVLSGGEDPDDPPPAIFGRARPLGMKLNWKRSGNYIATPGMGEMPGPLAGGTVLLLLVGGAIALWYIRPKGPSGRRVHRVGMFGERRRSLKARYRAQARYRETGI